MRKYKIGGHCFYLKDVNKIEIDNVIFEDVLNRTKDHKSPSEKDLKAWFVDMEEECMSCFIFLQYLEAEGKLDKYRV